MSKKNAGNKGPRAVPARKSGKSGIGAPLDPKEDFEQPARKESAKKEPEQQELLKHSEEKAPAISNGRILAHYVKPHFSKKKAGDRTIAMELSFWLTDGHEDHIPKQVSDGWKFMAKKGNKRLDIVDVPGQFVKFWLTSDDKQEALVLPAARMDHVSLQVVESKGTGQKQKVIRLSFRLEVKMTADIGRFAEFNFGEALWITLDETQESLFDEEEE